MSNNWLKQRSEILAKYAESLPMEYDRIQISFEYPLAGWMPVHFHKNGVDMGFFEISDVYDSFEPLRKWLETIATISYDKASVVNLDCEDLGVALYYEPIWFYDQGTYKGTVLPECTGIFSVYGEAEGRFLLDAYCYTDTFVRDMYKGIMDFAKAMSEKPEFVEDWVSASWNHEWGELEDDDPKKKEIFINKVKSPSIQAFIEWCDKLQCLEKE